MRTCQFEREGMTDHVARTVCFSGKDQNDRTASIRCEVVRYETCPCLATKKG